MAVKIRWLGEAVNTPATNPDIDAAVNRRDDMINEDRYYIDDDMTLKIGEIDPRRGEIKARCVQQQSQACSYKGNVYVTKPGVCFYP